MQGGVLGSAWPQLCIISCSARTQGWQGQRRQRDGYCYQNSSRAIWLLTAPGVMNAALIGPARGVGLASPLPGPRAGTRRAALAPRPAPRICGGVTKRLSRPALAIAAMAAPPWPAAMAAAAGGGGALGTFALAGLVMAALVALASSWRRSMSDLSKIPGPKQLPLLGNLIELGHPQAHQTLVELANRFGSLMRWGVLEP